MVTLEAVQDGSAEGRTLMPPDGALAGLAAAHLTEAQVTTMRRGQAVLPEIAVAASAGRRVRAYGPD
jgi:hypothetical protein